MGFCFIWLDICEKAKAHSSQSKNNVFDLTYCRTPDFEISDASVTGFIKLIVLIFTEDATFNNILLNLVESS